MSMGFEDETDDMLAENDARQEPYDGTADAVAREVVEDIRRESLDDYLLYGLPYDPSDPDIPKVRRHG